MNYLNDLALSIESISVLLLSELVQSPTLGEITRQGFITGWSGQGSSGTTIAGQKTIIKTLNSQLTTPEARSSPQGLFRRVYKHTFKIALPSGTRGLPLEMACEYWKLLFGPTGAHWDGTAGAQGLTKPWLQWWMTFLQEKWKKDVNKDMWEQTLALAEKTRGDESLGWWSEEDSAWPSVIDDFIAWCKKEKGVGDQEMELS